MSTNIASIRRGGALVSWRGASFYHRGELSIPLQRDAIEFDVEPFGIAFRSHDRVQHPINLRPSGRISEVSAIVNRYNLTTPGELINIEEYPVTIDATTDVLTTATAHLLTTGDEVMVHWLVTAPGGLSRTTRYYARVVTSTTLTLHTSAAGAIADSGKVDITTAGSGVVLDVTRPLVVHTFDGLKIKYHNAGLVNLGELNFSAAETLLAEVGFMAFVRNGQDAEDPANGYHEITYEAFADTSFDPADIPTGSPVLSWDYDAAWTDLPTREGATVAFELETANLPSDAFGEDALGMMFRRLEVTASAAVQGITESEAKDALKAQSARRGAKIEGDGPLVISTPAIDFEIADAALVAAPQNFGSENQRSGDFEWRANAGFTSGAKDALYELTEN